MLRKRIDRNKTSKETLKHRNMKKEEILKERKKD